MTDSASEMSVALSQGVIDGVMTSPAGWVDLLGNTAKYGTLVSGMALATSAITTDKRWFDGLPDGQRQIIREVLQDIIVRQWQETLEKDRVLIAQMVQQGGHFRVMDSDETENLKQLVAPGSAAFSRKHVDVMTQLTQLRGECHVER